MEDLNKTQIILVTLLVSFVTSIATGITTVTLMDQAPPGVTQTINRVVEHTVERVVPSKSQPSTVVETVVVKEENLLKDAVAKNAKGLVRLYAMPPKEASGGASPAATTTPETALGLGFILPDGSIITDSGLVSNNTSYLVKTDGAGDPLSAKVVSQDEEEGLAMLRFEKNEEKETHPAVSLGDSEGLTLGETVALLGGINEPVVETGIITNLKRATGEREVQTEENGETKTKTEEFTYVKTLGTNIALNQAAAGSILFTVNGDVVGMLLSRQTGDTVVPANTIKTFLAAAPKDGEEKPE